MNKKLLTLVLFITSMLSTSIVQAATYYYEGSGSLDVAANWNQMPDGSGTSPANFSGNHIWVIQNGQTVTYSGATWDINSGISGSLRVDSTASLTLGSGGSIIVNAFIVRGTYIHNTGLSNVPGNSRRFHSGNNGLTTGHGTVIIQDAGNTTLPHIVWGNLTFNVPSVDLSTAQGRDIRDVRGDLEINSGFVVLNDGGTNNTEVRGDFKVNTGATLVLSTNSINKTIDPYKDLIINGTVYRDGPNWTRFRMRGLNYNITIGSSATLDNSNIQWRLMNNSSYTLNGNLTNAATRDFDLNGNATFVISANSIFTNNGNADFNGNNVTLKSNATSTGIIGNGNAILDATNITIERYITNRRAWRLLSAPLVAATAPTILNSWQEGVEGGNPNPGYGTWITAPKGPMNGYDSFSPSVSIKFWNNTAWGNIDNTIVPKVTDFGGAWHLFVRGDKSVTGNGPSTSTTLRMTGTLNQGNVNNVGTAGASMSLIGNPYPSPVDYEQVFLGNGSTYSTIYVWDANLGSSGGYRTITRTGANTYSATPNGVVNPQYIQSGQAFFIAGNGTLNFTESMKVSSVPSQTVFKSVVASGQRMNINLNSIEAGEAQLADGVSLEFGAAYKTIPSSEDVLKLENFGENLSINHQFNNYSIEKRGEVTTTETVQLNLWNVAAKTYQLSIESSNFEATTTAYLVDAYTSTTTPLNMMGESIYEFAVSADPKSQDLNRFKIIFDNSRKMATTTASSVVVFPNPMQGNSFNIAFNNIEKGAYTLQVTSLSGTVMAAQSIQHEGAHTYQMTVPTTLAAGIYNITVLDVGGKTIATQKMVK